MVIATLVTAGRPVSGRMVKYSMMKPIAPPAIIAAIKPTTGGKPSTTETW